MYTFLRNADIVIVSFYRNKGIFQDKDVRGGVILNKTFIGSFPNAERLAAKIFELKREGVEERDLYIVMKDELAIDELRSNCITGR